MQNKSPSNGRKSRNLSNGYLILLLLLIIAVANIFMISWLDPSDAPRRSLVGLEHYEFRRNPKTNDDNNSDDDILHVVISRFMQGQSTLKALAEARLRLFETFCLPTMLNQDADNFLWFVMTDPSLDPELMERLQNLLKPRPNFYLLKSNAHMLTTSDVTAMLLSNDEYNNIDRAGANQTIMLSGDIDLLRNQMLDPNRSLLLETRLDADDGLHSATLSMIQETANALPGDTRGWQIICSNIHFEWRNEEVLAFDNSKNKTKNNNNTLVSSPGTLRLVHESMCVTPGYTLVRHREHPSIDFPTWPKLGHHRVIAQWPECKFQDESFVGMVVESNNGNATHDCWKRMQLFPSAFRSRTVTSAGMRGMQTPTRSPQKTKNQTQILWEHVQQDFNIAPQQAVSVSQYMRDHLEGIAADNLKGQWYVSRNENKRKDTPLVYSRFWASECFISTRSHKLRSHFFPFMILSHVSTPGHSCKNSSRTQLENVLAQTKQWKLNRVS